jgi:hypothetical protein
MKFKSILLTLILVISTAVQMRPYPIDGYEETGIRRLRYLQLILEGELTGTAPVKGAQLPIDSIRLNLLGERGDSLNPLPDPDPELQRALDALFPNLHESYSISLLDITPGRPMRYAQRQEKRTFQPGSVGKLAVISGLFCELEAHYPDSIERRKEILRTKMIRAGRWALPNQHTVPHFDPETNKYFRRRPQADDVFSLYEWVDHMMSVSSNGAASVVWREAILLRMFGKRYAELTEEEANAFFEETPRSKLSEIGMAVVNEPLRETGITEDEWRLGSFFTREAGRIVPGSGGSAGSPYGLMKWLVAMERGQLIDEWSSLEIKRMMYMTARRIRYASNHALDDAAVYFKSGSLYKCKEEEGFQCGKYRGNVYNYMNSVAIVERPDSTTYMVTLMTNVLRKNSKIDHNVLGGRIDKIVRE